MVYIDKEKVFVSVYAFTLALTVIQISITFICMCVQPRASYQVLRNDTADGDHRTEKQPLYPFQPYLQILTTIFTVALFISSIIYTATDELMHAEEMTLSVYGSLVVIYMARYIYCFFGWSFCLACCPASTVFNHTLPISFEASVTIFWFVLHTGTPYGRDEIIAALIAWFSYLLLSIGCSKSLTLTRISFLIGRVSLIMICSLLLNTVTSSDMVPFVYQHELLVEEWVGYGLSLALSVAIPLIYMIVYQ